MNQTIKHGKHAGKTIAQLYEEDPGLVRRMATWQGEVGEMARAYLAMRKKARLAERYGGRTFSDEPAIRRHPEAMDAGDDRARASILAEAGLKEDNDLDEQFWNRDA